MKSRSSGLARARPLLGTLVEIRAAEGPRALSAIAAAFDAIAEVHRLMSAHDDASDVARLNRLAHREPIAVDRHTWRVLKIARAISAASGGAFDICVAPALARWGYLPGAGQGASATAGWQHIEFAADRRIHFRAPIAIDLGGIAKGYAVDRAAQLLRSHGIRRYTVNAGGDLCVGQANETIHVRDPAMPGLLLPIGRLRNAAVATSATYFARRRRNGACVHPIVVPASGDPAELEGSVTVFARHCVIADALTKVVAVMKEKSAPVLQRYGAQACIIDRSRKVLAIGARAHLEAA
jgi:thiamine biosynthesis lipoprotein